MIKIDKDKTIMVISDLHGNLPAARRAAELAAEEKADIFITCGDNYYHGIRNPVTDGYAPMETANLLNGLDVRILAVKGNCDSEVDQMVSRFRMKREISLLYNGRVYLFTHGHKFNMSNPPVKPFDVLVYGHEHVGYVKKSWGRIFANAGSMSLPKYNSAKSYIVINKEGLFLKSAEDKSVIGKVLYE